VPRIRVSVLLSILALLAATSSAASSGASIAGHWSGEAKHRGRTLHVSVDIPDAPGAVALVDYAEVPVYAAPFEWTVEDDTVLLRRDPPGGPLTTIRLEPRDERLHGTLDGAGAVAAEIVLERDDDAPERLRETPLSFANAEVKLAGTVVWPSGTGPFAAVVITHGSGEGHRDQALYRTDAFRYARRGVAALIYDKRGSGASTGDWRTSSLHDLARDALAGLRALQALDGIRDDLIGVAGHSQGGWIAPLAATMSNDVAFVVATSASGLDPMSQSLFHNANEMRAAGFSDEDVAQAQSLRKRMYRRVESGKLDDDFEKDLQTASTQRWFAASQLPTPPIPPLEPGVRELLRFDPPPVWREVKVPVLAVWGAEDIHLPAAKSRDLIAAALRDGGNEAVELHVLDGVEHGFFPPRRPDAPWDFPRGDARLERILAEWLQRISSDGTSHRGRR
jgi:pimeloyl-ACP methyl ester carboxylesterase